MNRPNFRIATRSKLEANVYNKKTHWAYISWILKVET